MRKRYVTLALLVSILVVLSAFAFIQYSGAFLGASEDFTLTATGSAYDPRHHQTVDIQLTMTGETYGKRNVQITLVIRGGSMQVENQGTFSIANGFGVIIRRYHFVFLHFRMTHDYYGGYIVTWNLRGRVGDLHNNALPITLSANRLRLPLQGYPVLYNLLLRGTITPASD